MLMVALLFRITQATDELIKCALGRLLEKNSDSFLFGFIWVLFWMKSSKPMYLKKFDKTFTWCFNVLSYNIPTT